MPHRIEIPDDLFARLQRHAVPFVDTPTTVIERALVALEAGDEEPVHQTATSEARTFNPAAPPDLKFTTVRSASVGGQTLRKAEAYWNTIMLKVIAAAAAQGVMTDDILFLVTVNSQKGRREDNGFKYVKEANLSIQGQDANAAWRQAYTLASSFGIELEVSFIWQDNSKASKPNQAGSFFVEGQ